MTADFDRPFGDQSIGDLLGHGEVAPRPVWAPDGRSLYHQVSDSGMTHLVRVDMATGQVTPLTAGRRVIYSFSMDRTASRAALGHADPTTPNDVWLLLVEPGLEERRLTRVNQAVLEGITLAEPERYTSPSDDVAVEGWIMRPPGRANAQRTPAVLEVHGGPMVMYGYLFFFEFQLLASHGFTMVYTNPRGSMGYGQEFVAAIRGDWGNQDFQDVMNGIEAAVKRGGIDPERVAIAGGSYGGFMVNWALGHTDRFRTGIAMRSIANEYSMFGTSDFGFTDVTEFGGTPWEVPTRYLERSPIAYVKQVKAPLLMIQSENDLRTPMEQAEQFYTAVKLVGPEVVLLRYPKENHDLSRTGQPWHRIHRLESIIEWAEKHLKA